MLGTQKGGGGHGISTSAGGGGGGQDISLSAHGIAGGQSWPAWAKATATKQRANTNLYILAICKVNCRCLKSNNLNNFEGIH
jgi:hypothetical protein